LNTADLRDLLKSVEGPDAELTPAHYPVASTRAILLRLLNNIKLRAVEAGRTDRGLQIAQRMLFLQPDSPLLWHEIGVLNARQGHLGAAMEALQRVAALDSDGVMQGEVAALMQALRKKLN
jgi:regulator of sirC expression with transglutaminase-like and TPR domain